MRPSDMDAIARVIAVQVKDIVDAEIAALPQADPVDTSHLDDEIKKLRADNADLVSSVDVLSGWLGEAQAAIKEMRKEPDADEIARSVRDQVTKELPEPVDTSHLDVEMKQLRDDNANLLKSVEVLSASLGDAEEAIRSMQKEAGAEDIAKEVLAQVLKQLPEPMEPTAVQVIEAVKAIYPAIRHDLLQRIPTPSHKGLWDADTKYDVGDEVMKDGSTWRLLEDTADAPPSDAWQLVSMKGKIGKKGYPGKDGEPGKEGPAGVGLEDAFFEDGQIVVSFTNGDTKNFDVGIADAIAKAVKEFMLDVKGENDGTAA